METTDRDIANNANPQNDWRNAETNNRESKDFSDADAPRYEEKSFDDRANFAASITSEEINGIDRGTEERIPNRTDEPIDSPIYAASGTPDPDEDDEDEEEDDEGDWGHVDPAEGNSPFPDSNDPSGPGSAV